MQLFKSRSGSKIRELETKLSEERDQNLKLKMELLKSMDREHTLRSDYFYQKKRAERLERRISAMKGVITKMKQEA